MAPPSPERAPGTRWGCARSPAQPPPTRSPPPAPASSSGAAPRPTARRSCTSDPSFPLSFHPRPRPRESSLEPRLLPGQAQLKHVAIHLMRHGHVIEPRVAQRGELQPQVAGELPAQGRLGPVSQRPQVHRPGDVGVYRNADVSRAMDLGALGYGAEAALG